MRSIKNMALLFLMALSGYCYGQEKNTCLTDELYEAAAKKDPSLREKKKQLNEAIIEYRKQAMQKSGTIPPSPMVIPVVVYIMHDGTPQSDVSDIRVQNQIQILNDRFAGSDISFCLAKKIGSTATTGIFHIQSVPNVIHDAATEQLSLIATAGIEVDQYRFLRIWVVDEITNNGAPTDILGYAGLPGIGFEGVVMRKVAFNDAASCPGCYFLPGYNQGETLVHEIGHYLGLDHTFLGNCDTPYGDCHKDGDGVCDTPPSKKNFSCTSGLDTCGGDSDVDDIQNFMAYSNDLCKVHFTPGQIEKMTDAIHTFRPVLVSADTAIATETCGYENLVTSTFEASDYYHCAGANGNVNFTPLLTDGDSYLWNFGDPSSPANTSNLKYPTHPFTSAANSPYTVTLTVTKGGQTSVSTEEIYVTACSPIQSTQGHWYFGVKNGLDFSSGVPVFDDSAIVHDIDFGQLGEAAAVQSNAAGQLLFYTNGTQVFDSTHAQINGGNLLMGHQSSHNGVLIVPRPGSATQYCIFTKDAFEGADNGFRYSIVTVTGSTVTMNPATTNLVIPPPPGCLAGNGGAALGSEGITAIAACNNNYWILTAAEKSSGYFISSYLLDATTVTYAQMATIPTTATSPFASIKASPDGNRVAYFGASSNAPTPSGGESFLYTFNKYTGAFTNRISLETSTAYGGAFSPNSQLFYTGGGMAAQGIFQYDLSDANPAQSRKKITATGDYSGDFQLGPDNKIYFRGGLKKLGVIHKPNNLVTEGGNECQYTNNAVNVPLGINLGLPNFIAANPGTVYTNQITATPVKCMTYTFSPNICGNNFAWNFADSINNLSSLQSPQHEFSGPGTYHVTVTVSGVQYALDLVVEESTPPTISGNTTACVANNSQTYHYTSLDPGEKVKWSVISGAGSTTVATQQDVTVTWTSLPGTIRAITTDVMGCTNYTDQIITSYCVGDACPENIVFDLPETATTQTYNVSNSIITGDNYRVNSGSDITLIANNFILIKTDSFIKPGAKFLAKIDECPTPAPRPAIKSGEESQLIAYPNPTDGLLYLQGIKFNEVYLFDVLGKSVFYSQYDSIDNTTIDMARLTQGVYFLKVIGTDGNSNTLKIIKE